VQNTIELGLPTAIVGLILIKIELRSRVKLNIWGTERSSNFVRKTVRSILRKVTLLIFPTRGQDVRILSRVKYLAVCKTSMYGNSIKFYQFCVAHDPPAILWLNLPFAPRENQNPLSSKI
jgi:hypothetical protein